ncbi:MAG: DUF2062 domain-containing protein [Bacteroidia bacterium]
MQKIFQLFKTKIIQIFTYGLSPLQLALTLSFGITLGLFPFIGLTSILCFIFAFIFRLNWVVIQLVNWVVSPLQLVMLVPFYQLGNYFNLKLFNNNIAKIEIDILGKNELLQKIIVLINSQILAIIGWVFICIPLALFLHFTSLFLYKKYLNRKKMTLKTFEKN